MILTQGRITRFWLPLATMWILMALEQPMLSAVIARLPEAKLNLAAYALTFALALVVESPVIMFLTMGTALTRSRQSYLVLMRFTNVMAWALTILHLVIGLTPLYRLIVGSVVGAPPEIVEPSRIAFLLMTPWAAAIAYRRFWQGVLIRYQRTTPVAGITAIRLAATGIVAFGGLAMGTIPGANVAAVAVSTGVVVSALAAWILVRPTVRKHLSHDAPDITQLTWPALTRFYLPLAMTSLIN